MPFPSCSLWFFVARTDLPFMMQTIPHLVKMNNFPFEEKVIAIDTAPLSGEKVNRPGIGTMEELRSCVQKLLDMKVVDRVVDFNYDPLYRKQVYQKHFGSPLKNTHNYKGYPILGSIFKIEDCKSDFMLHFDSDMMMYQNPNCSWIKEAMILMETHPEIMFIRPLAGPPTEDGKPIQAKPDGFDEDGFLQFKFFGSRLYLVNRKRFKQMLPIPVIWRPYKHKWLDHLPVSIKTLLNIWTGGGKLDSWEVMVSKKLEQTDYYRATLTSPNAWTLHPIDRSPAFIKALPDIIKRVENNDYPVKQAGYYDLISKLWF
ncbi:hypothetical protein C7H19_21935 [Aphanothece hegewaldii CCALA 016]|uniref:Glycosyl transferase n=1 Tax=Aphanothece hegewaldii CCALA 016 TaxID=2107694 RepID=A0A2T1LS73_9CHRO|nr:hypothetical protein [Aphanothece hegewaldii]PSF32107.1 hypothetical protein C7H19_21935 [Aphanothece hegewaldii CCALA 016]